MPVMTEFIEAREFGRGLASAWLQGGVIGDKMVLGPFIMLYSHGHSISSRLPALFVLYRPI